MAWKLKYLWEELAANSRFILGCLAMVLFCLAIIIISMYKK